MRLALGLIAALTATAAQAQAPAPEDKCDIVVQSRTGGLIEVTPAKASAQGQILWRPVGSGPGLILLVAYPPASLARFAEPSGVVILFQPKDQANPETLSVQVKTRNGRAWRFSGPAIAFSKDEARIAFGQEWPYGRGLLGAIADGQDLTMAVQENDQTLNQESFSLGNIDARDTLLAQARARFTGAGCAAP
jgi:hypothetical protein